MLEGAALTLARAALATGTALEQAHIEMHERHEREYREFAESWQAQSRFHIDGITDALGLPRAGDGVKWVLDAEHLEAHDVAILKELIADDADGLAALQVPSGGMN